MTEGCVIEVHEAGLTVVDSEGVRLTSPACAVAVEAGLEVGGAASARSRRDPRRTLDYFWERLDREPLPLAASPARTSADVAYFHLRSVWNEANRGEREVLLAVPATFDRTQLSLLVGIAQACAIPVAGLVEATVAAAATVDDPRPRLVLDVGPHRSTATRVDAGAGLSLGESRTVSALGLADLYDAWAALIAARFVRETRFDPLHDGRTEQLLYDRLPEWLAMFRGSPVGVLELPVGERKVRIELARDALLEAAEEVYRPLTEAATGTEALVLVGSRLAALPGFPERIAARSAATPLAPGAAGRAALAHADAIRSDGRAPAFVTRLSGPIPDAERGPAHAHGESTPCPTHVLHRSRAYPIERAPLLLDADPPRFLRRGESAHGCIVRVRGGAAILEVPEAATAWVNGRPARGETPLRLGDALRVGGPDDEFRLIVLVPDHAST